MIELKKLLKAEEARLNQIISGNLSKFKTNE